MIYKTLIWEQEKVWVQREIFFEADSIKDAEKKIREGNLQTSIVDYGEAEYCLDTSETTGNYDYSTSIRYLDNAPMSVLEFLDIQQKNEPKET